MQINKSIGTYAVYIYNNLLANLYQKQTKAESQKGKLRMGEAM